MLTVERDNCQNRANESDCEADDKSHTTSTRIADWTQVAERATATAGRYFGSFLFSFFGSLCDSRCRALGLLIVHFLPP